jgi:hypothetical protein
VYLAVCTCFETIICEDKAKNKDCGGTQDCEILRLPHFSRQLIDGGEVVSLTLSCPLPPGRFLVLISDRG